MCTKEEEELAEQEWKEYRETEKRFIKSDIRALNDIYNKLINYADNYSDLEDDFWKVADGIISLQKKLMELTKD